MVVAVGWSTPAGTATNLYTGTYTLAELFTFLMDLKDIGFIEQYAGEDTVRLQRISQSQIMSVAIHSIAEEKI